KPPTSDVPPVPDAKPPTVDPPKVDPPKVDPAGAGDGAGVKPPEVKPPDVKPPEVKPPETKAPDPVKQPDAPKETPKDQPTATAGKSPADIATEIVTRNKGSVTKSLDELNAQGFDQPQMVEALKAAWKAAGKDTAGAKKAADGSIVLLSRRQ